MTDDEVLKLMHRHALRPQARDIYEGVAVFQVGDRVVMDDWDEAGAYDPALGTVYALTLPEHPEESEVCVRWDDPAMGASTEKRRCLRLADGVLRGVDYAALERRAQEMMQASAPLTCSRCGQQAVPGEGVFADYFECRCAREGA